MKYFDSIAKVIEKKTDSRELLPENADYIKKSFTSIRQTITIEGMWADWQKEHKKINDLADRIIEGRPYKNKAGLATRGVLPMGGYISLKRSIVALQKETVTSEKPRKAGAPAKKAQASAKKADAPAKKADEATTKADGAPKK